MMKREMSVLSLVVLACVVTAQPRCSLGDEPVNPAKATYLRYCSACHGEGGKGDGVVSQLMRPKPTDLTKLAKANKGEFPYAQTIRIIDGRETIRAHGDPDMPVWGEIFQLDDGMTFDKQATVRGRLMLIMDYLSSIQVK